MLTPHSLLSYTLEVLFTELGLVLEPPSRPLLWEEKAVCQLTCAKRIEVEGNLVLPIFFFFFYCRG